MPPNAAQCPTQDQIPQEFNEELVRELAMLVAAERDFANAAIALVGFGSRSVLEQQGVITMHGAPPEIVTITDRGWEVIAQCARFVEQADTQTWVACRGEAAAG